jgi:plastocyanin
MSRNLWLWGLCLVLAFATACGGGEKSSPAPSATTGSPAATQSPTAAPPPATTTAPTGNQITIQGNSFGSPLVVKPGSLITIVNKDSVEHSVTSDVPGVFDVRVAGGQQATFVAPQGNPAAPRSIYDYHDTNNPSMKGSLVVKK